MAFEPGDVVFLKSGGQPLTVAGVEEDSVDCIGSAKRANCFARPSRPSR